MTGGLGVVFFTLRELLSCLHLMTIQKPTDLLEGIGYCLDELEQEYLKFGIDHCKGLEDHSQLSAFLMLGIRSICLLRGMLRLCDPQFRDSYDSVRRSFIESWQLQFEFKLRDSNAKAQKWLERQPEWQADRKKLEGVIKKLHGGEAGFTREWAGLSEMAHPTHDATVNSVAIASTLFGMNPRPHRLEEEFQKLATDYVGMVNRVIWLTLQKYEDFTDVPLQEAQFPKSVELHKKFLEAGREGEPQKTAADKGAREQ